MNFEKLFNLINLKTTISIRFNLQILLYTFLVLSMVIFILLSI